MTQRITSTTMAEVFKALGDKTRYELVRQLRDHQGACVSELAQNIDISVAGVSQQLKILENAGVIHRVRDGQRICYELNSDNRSVSKVLELL